MKKLALIAHPLAFGLVACDNAAEDTVDEPMATETMTTETMTTEPMVPRLRIDQRSPTMTQNAVKGMNMIVKAMAPGQSSPRQIN